MKSSFTTKQYECEVYFSIIYLIQAPVKKKTAASQFVNQLSYMNANAAVSSSFAMQTK